MTTDLAIRPEKDSRTSTSVEGFTRSRVEKRAVLCGGIATVAEAGVENITLMKTKLLEEILAPYANLPDDFTNFANMPLSVLQRLIDLGFVNLQRCQYNFPGIQEVVAFLRRNPTFDAHGCVNFDMNATTPVIVEGVSYIPGDDLTAEQIIDFATTFKGADELDVSRARGAYCWYD